MESVLWALYGTLFTWGMTAVGAAVVFISSEVRPEIMDGFYGFSAGVMLSASCFGLLLPAIEGAKSQGWSDAAACFPILFGFIGGVLLLKGFSYVLPALRAYFSRSGFASVELQSKIIVGTHENDEPLQNVGSGEGEEEVDIIIGLRSRGRNESGVTEFVEFMEDSAPQEPPSENSRETWKRMVMLVTAITLHNIPEGLAVGVGFGAIHSSPDPNVAFSRALALALGVGLQNFPEGLGVSMPLRREGLSAWEAFWWGQLSGLVEPLGGLIGAWAVSMISAVLPVMLAFAAGAMLFVVLDELLPAAAVHGRKDITTLSTLLGFALMMVLDISLG